MGEGHNDFNPAGLRPKKAPDKMLWTILAINLSIGASLLILGIHVDDPFWAGILVNLSETFLGLFLAVLTVNFFLEQRKRKEWEPVKQEVYKDLRISLQGLFYDIAIFSDDPAVGYVEAVNQGEMAWMAIYHQKVKEFAAKSKITLLPEVKEGFRTGNWETLFKIRLEQVTSVQVMYSRYFDPAVTIALMKIVRALGSLVVLMGIYIKNKPGEETRFFEDMEVLFAAICKGILSIDEDLNLFTKRTQNRRSSNLPRLLRRRVRNPAAVRTNDGGYR